MALLPSLQNSLPLSLPVGKEFLHLSALELCVLERQLLLCQRPIVMVILTSPYSIVVPVFQMGQWRPRL